MNFGDARTESPRLVQPPRGPVLVIAAQAEDALLGLGGTLALHAAQGDPVHVLVLFAAAPGVEAAAGSAAGQLELFETDSRGPSPFEHEPCGWPLVDTPSQDELFRQAHLIARRIVDRRATSVYAPWHGELGPTYFAASQACALAVELADFDGEPLGYEVRTPLVPACVVDISAVWDRKRSLLEAQGSQSALLRACEGLAAHRSLLLQDGATHGEAFSHLLDLRIRVPRSSQLAARRAS